MGVLPATAGVLVLVGLASFTVGRYGIPPIDVVRALSGQSTAPGADRVVLMVRLPRVLLAMLIGGGLALAGAVLQAVFRNPLVSPDIIGVSSGASLGGALALMLGLGSAALLGMAFGSGLFALVAVFLVSRSEGRTPMLTIVLAGVVVGAFFSALVSLLTYIADPYSKLPAIVFWLLGSLATATYPKVLAAAIPVLGASSVILALRWRINVLSLGDSEAMALGIRPEPLRWLLLCSVAAIAAGAVAVSGVIGWVGLIMPHVARIAVGPDHRILLPVSFMLGAAYLTGVDTLARTLTAGEVPLGVLTAVLGAPAFFVLLRRGQQRAWSDG